MRYTKLTPFTTLAAACGLALSASAVASADFVLVDDFENYAVGDTVLNTNDYAGGNSTAAVVADPEGADQALNVIRTAGVGENLAKFNAIDVEDGSVGTVFFQMRFDTNNDPNFVFSLGQGDNFFSSVLAFKVRGAPTPGELSLENASAAPISTLDVGATYNVFAVVDNATGAGDALELYLQSDDDADFANVTQIASTFTKGFGDQPGTDSIDVLTFSAFNEDGVSGPVIDNIFYDDAGVNLANPVPEPAAIGAAMLLVPLALRRAR